MDKRRLIMVPGPTNVPDRVFRAMMKPIISHRGSEFRTLYKRISENLKYLFQTDGEVFVLTASGTGGVECAISNIVNPGDKVEYGDAPRVSQIEEAVREHRDLKAIAIVYNETSTGVTVRDLPKIGEVAKEFGIPLIVDAVSILGGDKLPVDEWGIDICVAGSQKCLACPPGISLISVSDEAWEIIGKTISRPFYFDLIRMREFASRFETPFTPAIPLLYALDESLKMIREEGLEKRFRRHRVCGEAFYDAVEAMGLEPFPKRDVRSNTVIAFKKPSEMDGLRVREIMRDRYNVVIAGGAGRLKDQIFRIGCMGAISEAETLITISALENALKDVGYPVEIGAGIKAARTRFSSHPIE